MALMSSQNISLSALKKPLQLVRAQKAVSPTLAPHSCMKPGWLELSKCTHLCFSKLAARFFCRSSSLL